MSINWHDTLYSHHAFVSHQRQGLDQLVSEYLDSSPWKLLHGRRGARKLSPDKMTGEQLAEYNASDVRLTAKVWDRMQADLAPHRHVYEHDLCLAELCVAMMYAGIQVDRDRQQELSGLLASEAEYHVAQLRELARDPEVGPYKNARLRIALYDFFRVKPGVRSEKTGLPSTGKEVIEALRGEDSDVGKFCHHLSKARECLKSKSTYVDYPFKGDKNNGMEPIVFPVAGNGGHWDPLGVRAHYQWGPRERRNQTTSGGGHTVSGRLASRLQSAPRYNRLNTPDRVREIYVPRSSDHVFVYFDVKQGEPRVAAFLSGDPARIETTKGDVHAANAKVMFPEVAERGWLDGPAMKDANKGKSFRDLAKTAGLAIDYFAEPDTAQNYMNKNRFDPVTGKANFNAISLSTVTKIIARIRSKYRVYVAYVHSNLEGVRARGWMKDPILGRVRWLGWEPSINDVSNFPVQSTLAGVMNLRSLYLQGTPRFRAWVKQNSEIAARVDLPSWETIRPLDPRVSLVAQVHDSCIYDTPKTLVGMMEDKLNRLWAGKIHLPGGELVLPIDLKSGATRLSECG
jgi:hypothetical protein